MASFFARAHWRKAKEAILRRGDLYDDDPEVQTTKLSNFVIRAVGCSNIQGYWVWWERERFTVDTHS